jgi:hypothetical protein
MTLKFSKSKQLRERVFEDVGTVEVIKKMTKSSKSKMKAKAWSEFSKYIRQSYAVNGKVSCYTCGKSNEWKTMQAGHGIGGRGNAILFEERVVRPQCVGCNIFGRGQYRIFTRKLIAELGLKEYDELVKQADTLKKLMETDLKEIYEKYKELNKKYGTH